MVSMLRVLSGGSKMNFVFALEAFGCACLCWGSFSPSSLPAAFQYFVLNCTGVWPRNSSLAIQPPAAASALGHWSSAQVSKRSSCLRWSWVPGFGGAGWNQCSSSNCLQFALAAPGWLTLLVESPPFSARSFSASLSPPPFIPAVRQLINCTGRPSVHNIVMS